MAVPFVDAGELARNVPIAVAIDALEAAFRDGDPSATPLRSHVDHPPGHLADDAARPGAPGWA